MSGTGYRLVLLVGLLSAALVGWHAWRRTRTVAARTVWLGAVSVLGCLALWFLFGTVARVAGLEPRLWAAPLDRLLGVACLVALGWTLSAPGLGGRRWRLFLGVGLAAAAVAYLGWAPLWAQAFQTDPALSQDTTGLAQAWDAWQLVLALVVGVALLRGTGAPRWLLGVVGGLALGSLLELVVPLSATVPAWSRLGTLVAGTIIVAAAVSQATVLRPTTLDFHWPLRPVKPARVPRSTAKPAPDRPATPQETVATPPAAAVELAPVLDELARQATAIGGLTQVMEGLAHRLDGIERGLAAARPPVIEPAAMGPAQSTSPPPTVAADPARPPVAQPVAEPEALTVAAVAALEAARTRPATTLPDESRRRHLGPGPALRPGPGASAVGRPRDGHRGSCRLRQRRRGPPASRAAHRARRAGGGLVPEPGSGRLRLAPCPGPDGRVRRPHGDPVRIAGPAGDARAVA